MREIKFRGWDGKIMVYNPLSFNQNFKMNSLMQFTGKLDSTNEEIYEFDILRITEEAEFGDENHYFIVTWIKEWCMFAALDHTEYNGYLAKGIEAIDETMFWTYNLEESEQFTICGNIIEHPDYIMNACKEEENTMRDVLGDLDPS